MKAILVLLGFTLVSNQTPVHAAPSIEACPPDSVLSEDVCKCDPATCTKPPCLTELKIATNGTDLPGQCCPTYECVGCKEDEKIDGKCACAEGAVIDGYKCSCVDKEKHLVDGKCVCNPQLCPFPQLCDKKSVAVTITQGCCKKTICKPCPFDSESTNVEGDEIEDHCVCLPCKTECGYNKTVVIKKHGNGFPGNCCDLYECKKTDEIAITEGCSYGNLFYENGKEWLTPDSQICKCDNGLALCSNQKEEEELGCFVDNVFHNHTERWTKDDGCTVCTCKNGFHNCISYYCDNKVLLANHSCIKGDLTYHHGDKWTEKDGCILCTCNNGFESCIIDICETATVTTTIPTTFKAVECPSLTNCNRTCINGFKVNRRGCEICKCNAVRLGQDILTRYNISMNDLINILDEYKNRQDTTSITATSSSSTTSSSTSTTSSTTTTTTTTPTTTSSSKTVEVITQIPVVIMNRNAEFFEDSAPATSTTTEPSIRPSDKETDSVVYIVIPVLACAIFVIVLAIMCVYKSRRKSSVDLSQCHYQTVNNHNNNNTIKKTDQLL